MKLPPCVIRKTATMCYTQNCLPALYVKMPPCVIRIIATLHYTQSIAFFVFTYINPYCIWHNCTIINCSVHWGASRRPLPLLKNTGCSIKTRQLLNFCSEIFNTQDAKTISIYTLGQILHCRTAHRLLWGFGLLILSIFALFYSVLHPRFCLIRYIGLYRKFLLHSFM